MCFSAQYSQPLFSLSLLSGEKRLSPAMLESAQPIESPSHDDYGRSFIQLEAMRILCLMLFCNNIAI